MSINLVTPPSSPFKCEEAKDDDEYDEACGERKGKRLDPMYDSDEVQEMMPPKKKRDV